MIFIGERINTGFKDIKAAVIEHNPQPIIDWAHKQVKAGANYLDVNLGAASNKVEDLIWMIETVQNEVDTPISIDNNKPAMLKEAIPVCKKPPLVNSLVAIDERMDDLMPVIADNGASFIGLCMDEAGSPKSADKRVENAGKIMAKAMEYGIDSDQVFLDPIIMPLKFMQEQCTEIMKATQQFIMFSDPPPHVVGGLSNVANSTKHKNLINRVFCAMMVACGLDAVICDITDDELVDTVLTAELVMNKQIYADSYLEAFRS